MVEETRVYIKSLPDANNILKLLDARMEDIFSVGFLPNFKILNKCWVKKVSLQANEYRTVMQVSFISFLTE